MTEERARLTLPFAIIVAVLAVSTASIFIRFAQREAPSLVIAALRLTFASLVLAPVALTRYRDELKKLTRADLLLGLLSGVFARIPAGWVFGTVFFGALAGAAFLSGIAALEVLIAGLTDNTSLTRARATWIMAGIVFLLALPPMINMRIFVPWDLTFGSGAQTAGVFVAVLAVGWGMKKEVVLGELSSGAAGEPAETGTVFLYHWIRWVIPGAILAVGAWWFLTEVVGIVVGV